MPIKINGATSGSTTITAPDTGGDESIELSTALASKLPYSFGTATPSTTDSGFLWYDSNSTPPAPKYWDGSEFQPFPSGLVLLGQASLTGSAVAVNNVFSSRFNAYRLVFRVLPSTTADLQLRWRVGGVDATGADYYNQKFEVDNTTVTGSRTNNTVGSLGVIAGRSIVTVDVMSPAQSTFTNYISIVSSKGTGQTLQMRATEHSLSASYDGFDVFPSGTTFATGNVRVYGYGQ